MTISICDTERQDLINFKIKKFQNLATSFQVQISSLNAFFEVFKMLRHSRHLYNEIKSMFDTCDASCNHQKCFDFYKGLAVTMRDCYIKLYDAMKTNPFIFRIFGWLVHRFMIDWDDLAENIELGADPEFRDLIYRIAEKA